MMISPNQQPRLLGLLDKLDKLNRGDPQIVQERDERMASFEITGWRIQEHRDIITLYNNGLITSISFAANPENQWSSQGIYDYRLTGSVTPLPPLRGAVRKHGH